MPMRTPGSGIERLKELAFAREGGRLGKVARVPKPQKPP